MSQLVTNDFTESNFVQNQRLNDIATEVNTLSNKVNRQVLIENFGGVSSPQPSDVFDNFDAITAAIEEAARNGGVVVGLGGGWYPVSKTIVVKGDVGFLNVKLCAMSNFTGDKVLKLGTLTEPLVSAGGITNLTINTLGLPNLGGVEYFNCVRVSTTNLEVENNCAVGLTVNGEGYESYFTNVNVSGPVPPLAPAPDTSVAVRVLGSDNSFVNLAGSRNAIGLELIGSGNKFSMTHFWGTYYDIGHTRMRVCYHIKGQHNILNGVTIDSPARLNWGTSSSLSNGGIGVLIDTNAVDTTLVSPYLFLSSAGDSKPTTSSIIPVYTSKARTKILYPVARNDTGIADAVTNFLVTDNTATLRSSTVLGITQAGANMPENLYIGDSFVQWSPDLKIGGLSTGITYSNRRGMLKRIGSLCFFNININLSSKGSLSGALTFDLSITSHNEYSDYKLVFQGLIESQSGTVPCVGVLSNNSTTISLRNPETNAVLTDTVLTSTSRITITGSFLTSSV